MKKNKLRSVLTIILPLFVILGIASNVFAEGIKMSGSDWPVWELAHGMDELGRLPSFDFFDEKYATCIDGFTKGEIDVTFMTIYDFIATQRVNPNGVIIAVQDFSNGGDGVVLRDNVSSAAGLKGQALGLPTEAISLYLTHLYLVKNGMSLNDVKLINVPGEFVSKAYIANNSLAGIVGWNPNLDDAVAAGGKLAATSADFPENIFDCICVNKESLKNNRGAYVEFLKGWFKAVNDKSVVKAAAKTLDVSAKEFKSWLGDANIYYDAQSSLAMFDRMKVVAKDMQKFYSKKPKSVKGSAAGLFGKKRLDINGLFDDSLLKEITGL